MGRMLRAMSRDGSAILIVIDSKDIIEFARRVHNTSPTATAALGRTLSAASMMASLLKDEEDTISVSFKCDGPCGGIYAEGDYMGNVRGYIVDPQADLEPKAPGKLDVGRLVGRGTVTVVRDTGEKEPYIGITDIVTGEIAEDITRYFAESEQIPTVCSLGVLVDTDYSVLSSGGVLIQLMPGAAESTIDIIEKNLPKISSVSRLLADGKTIEDIASIAFDGIEYDIFDILEPTFKCRCSRERMGENVKSLGRKELIEIIKKEHKIEAVCHYCNSKYVFDVDDLIKWFGKQAQNTD